MQSPKTKQPLHPVLTVSQLTGQIKDVVEELFNNVYVVGEVSNAKSYPTGHWYFSLKDKDATLPCVCFKSANAGIKFKLEDGLMLVAQGKLSVYPPKGGYQLVASSLEPVGIGEWQLAFEQLRSQLEKEGLLDPAKKKPIPTVPRRIGIVTSPAAAALRDILSALSRRNRNVNIVISPARVQGEGSAEEIAQAIRDLQTVPGIEVIIVARGGGSIEDLWSFNTDVVARAVAACPIPIVSGVGHETDTTICDLVADLRAPTPTAAAELVARGSQELLEKYKNLEQSLVFKIDNRLGKARRQLERLSPITALTRYQGRLKQYQMRVGHYRTSMDRSLTHLVRNLQQRWHQKHTQLLALAPTNILNRGFAILRKLDGTVVCEPGNVKPGEELQAILKTGSLYINVAAVQESLFAVLDPRSAAGAPDELVSEVEFVDDSIQTSLFSLETFDTDSAIATSTGGTQIATTVVEISAMVASADALSEQVTSFDPLSDLDATSAERSIELSMSDEYVVDDLTSEEMSSAEVLEEVDEESVLVTRELDYSPTDIPEADEGAVAFASEMQVTTVFDQELANPEVLATIFGENIADVDSASKIFKSVASTERLEFDALNAELTKDEIPPLTPITVKVSTKAAKAMLEEAEGDSIGNQNDYSVPAGDDGFAPGGTLRVEESATELQLELATAGRNSKSLVPVNSRARPVSKNDGARTTAKVAAHQLNLFSSKDDD